MKTARLFYDDPYLKEFEAQVLDTMPYGEKYAVILDRTAFYPEGGGQPSDTGSIAECLVSEVIEKDGAILHIVDRKPEAKTVSGRIDWQRRFDYMQQHTGQHILSECFEKLYNGHTDSFHMGRDIVSIEISIDSFSADDAAKIEEMANGIIYENLPVTARVVDEAELQSLPLRKKPKVNENIRIVEVRNFDYSPCGGTHVATTGEVGMIKLKSWEKCKGGIRFVFVCGYRALRDYSLQNSIIRSLCERFSVRDTDVLEAANKALNDLKDTEKQLAAARQELTKAEADNMLKETPAVNGIRLIRSIFEGRSLNDIKLLAQYLTQAPGTIALLACRNETAQVIFSRSEDVSMDMNALFKSVITIIEGKGGGNARTAQGGGGRVENLESFLDAAIKKIIL